MSRHRFEVYLDKVFGFSQLVADLPEGRAPIFLCASGARTLRNSAALAGLAEGTAYGLAGGIMAWKQAGYPTSRGS